MYTKCPECNAIFRVTSEQLNIADGLVRCGICDVVFNGREHIDNEHSPVIDSDEQSSVEQSFESSITQDIDNDGDRHNELVQQNDDDTLIDEDAVPTAIREDFGGNLITKTNSPVYITVFTLGAIALAIFLLGQITYWQNVDLLPRTWVDSFCVQLGCGEKINRNLAAIKILNRNIYTHPNSKQALMITTSFVNQDKNAQPYPNLQISFMDTQGQLVAARRFSPNEYLVNKSLVDTLMPPNQPVGARLEIVDPGTKVIAYEFEFY